MNMQFIDLKRQYSQICEKINQNINNVLEHGRYIMGPEITKLEEELAQFCGVKHCVACSSGTDALLMPLLAWEIGPGDAVFTSPFTFVSTAEVISLLGATPVFCDIDEQTYNIDPEDLEKKINMVKEECKLKPKAIIPVDIFGLLADYGAILPLAEKHGLTVLEDAAQSFGASFHGRRACSYGNVAATSFFPAKPLGCYGDGGAVLTNDDSLYEKLLSIRNHGAGKDKYQNVRIGINGRMDSMQAGVLLAKLDIFERELEERNRIAARYSEKLKESFATPIIPEGYRSAWAQYSILAKDSAHRDKLMAALKEKDVPTAIYYPIPLHLQEAYENSGYKKGDLPVSEGIAERIFSIPMHPYLLENEIELICSTINTNS